MGKVQGLTGEFPDDPLFITFFPNADDGSVTVVEPPILAESDPDNRREVYANCISALEAMIEKAS